MTNILHKYRFIQLLGEGSFGTIYQGENLRTGEKVAIKVEPIKNETKLLKNETKIYQYLGNMKLGVPCVKWFGVDTDNNYMVMSLLGESLKERRVKRGRFSMLETVRIGIQLVERVKYIHDRGLVHRDIKPENFLFGTDEQDKLYIIDFGFSKRWVKEDRVDPSKKRNTITGTANFISVAVHNYFEPERKDDMESIMYIMMYLYMNELPWSTKEVTHEQVKEIKSEFISRCRTEIDFVALLVNYIQTIQACIGKPDYDFYICNFNKIIEKYK